jgi:predicted metal-binding membrane protein
LELGSEVGQATFDCFVLGSYSSWELVVLGVSSEVVLRQLGDEQCLALVGLMVVVGVVGDVAWVVLIELVLLFSQH